MTGLALEFGGDGCEGTFQDAGGQNLDVIGARTCGCLLGYMGYADIPGGGQLAYSEMGFVSPKGKRVEGEGVTPDIEVKFTRADIAAYRDRGLEAAVDFLQQKTATTKSLASVTESTK